MKVLRRLKPKVHIQKDFFVLDTETIVLADELKKLDPEKYKNLENGKYYYGLSATPDSFVLGVIYGHNFCEHFYSLESLKKRLEDYEFKNKIVFAHNAEYDLSVLYDNVYSFDNEAVYNGKLIKATNGVCTFADSMNIMRFAASKIGDMIGKPKLKALEEEMKKPYEGVTANVINYCIRDCEIIYDALFEFFETVGDIKITQASLSMSYYRRFFMPFDIHYNEILVKYFYNSYYGGRTEVFKLGKCDSTVYDIKSSYPYAMKNCVFPNPKYLKRLIRPSVDKLSFIMSTNEGCAKIKVIHKDTYFGFLPHKINGKLCFPVGSFTGWYNFNELRFALEHEVIEIIHVVEVVYSKPMESPFIEFVDELYDKKNSATSKIIETIFKLLLNSLYGKFAQRIKDEEIYIEDIDKATGFIEEKMSKGLLKNISMFNQVRKDCFIKCRREKIIDLSFAISSFSSYITSFARIHLLKKMLKSHKKYKVLYTDTDSVFLGKNPNYTDDNKLGGWSVEDKKVTEIRGLKNYTYTNSKGVEFEKIKGVPYNAVKIAKDTYEYSSLVKTKESLRRNIDGGKLVKRRKIIKGTYDKRIILTNGETKPIKL